METVMTTKGKFLAEKVASRDLVLLRVVGSPDRQVLRAKIEKIYSARHGIEGKRVGEELDFVCSAGTWGDVPLAQGERSLVFLYAHNGKFYEDPWRGHLIVEDIAGQTYGIYPHKQLWLAPDVPDEIKSHAIPDPARAQASAIVFTALESYLAGLIRQG